MSENIINNNIEADQAEYDSDDGYGSSVASDTTSLNSVIRQFITENGRTYHRYKEGKYLTPNDEAERDRLDFYHELQYQLLSKELFLAPIGDNPQRILDCGTGTGIWAIDVGERFPSAEVIGIDLSPIQPTWVVPNVRFEIDDLDDEWTFPKNHFDFVHTRQVLSGIRDLPRYFQQVFDHLKEGGYFEFSESGFFIHSDDDSLKGSKLQHFFDEWHRSVDKAGIKLTKEEVKLLYDSTDELNEFNHIEKYAKEAGFIDIEVKRVKQPWGAWPKEKALKHCGRMAAAIAGESCESYGLQFLTRYGGKSEEEAKKICREAGEEVCTNRHVHGYNLLWHVYGRKPAKA